MPKFTQEVRKSRIQPELRLQRPPLHHPANSLRLTTGSEERKMDLPSEPKRCLRPTSQELLLPTSRHKTSVIQMKRTNYRMLIKEKKNTVTFKTIMVGLPWWCSGWESACQCRGYGFEPWSGKIPHAVEQLGPWATTSEPARLEPVLRNKRGRDSERPAHCDEEWPPAHRN